jgi:cytoskeletal protein CcmA (bactofilin family)
MWGKDRTKAKSTRVTTLIGQGTEVQGDLVYQGGLHVEGTIKGNVVAEDGSQSVLILSERGRIEGEVRVPRLVLNGQVFGDVYASERVELAKHARVSGNVYYNMLEMAMGAEINGNMVHGNKDGSPLLEHRAKESALGAASEGMPLRSDVSEELIIDAEALPPDAQTTDVAVDAGADIGHARANNT